MAYKTTSTGAYLMTEQGDHAGVESRTFQCLNPACGWAWQEFYDGIPMSRMQTHVAQSESWQVMIEQEIDEVIARAFVKLRMTCNEPSAISKLEGWFEASMRRWGH